VLRARSWQGNAKAGNLPKWAEAQGDEQAWRLSIVSTWLKVLRKPRGLSILVGLSVPRVYGYIGVAMERLWKSLHGQLTQAVSGERIRVRLRDGREFAVGALGTRFVWHLYGNNM
jgi:hypothetical protein